jgi:hypothetical protein
VNDYKTDEEPAAIYGIIPIAPEEPDDAAVRKFLGDDDIPSKDETLIYGIPSQDLIKDYRANLIAIPSAHNATLYGPSSETQKLRISPLFPQVEGSLDDRMIRKLARQHIGEMRACVTTGLRNSGSYLVTFRFQVTPEGKVSNILLKSLELNTNDNQIDKKQNNTLHNINSCIQKNISTWRFPASEDGKLSYVELPIRIVLPDN